jgi:hypothetical protein
MGFCCRGPWLSLARDYGIGGGGGGGAPGRYATLLRHVVLTAKTYYPTFQLRLFVDKESEGGAAVAFARARGVEVEVRAESAALGRYWMTLARYLPLQQGGGVDVALVRDIDHFFSPREKSAVEKWLHSGRAAQVMRDHPLHGVEILAGNFGGRPGAVGEGLFAAMRNKSLQWDFYGIDQALLNEEVFPKIAEGGVALQFDEFNCDRCRGLCVAYPAAREPMGEDEWVGRWCGAGGEVAEGGGRYYFVRGWDAGCERGGGVVDFVPLSVGELLAKLTTTDVSDAPLFDAEGGGVGG